MKAYEIVSERFRIPRSRAHSRRSRSNSQTTQTTSPVTPARPREISDEELTTILRRNRNTQTSSRALKIMKAAGGGLLTLAGLFGAKIYVEEYYEQIAVLETQYEEAVQAAREGKELPDGHLFKGVNAADLKEEADRHRNRLLGKATFGVLTSVGFAGKIVSGFGRIIEVVPVVGLLGTGLRAMGFVLGKLEGSALVRLPALYWLENSDTGKQILEGLTKWGFFNLLGAGTDRLGKLLLQGAEELSKYVEKETGVKIQDIGQSTSEKEYDKPGDDKDLTQSRQLIQDLKVEFKAKFNKDLVTNSEERTREKQQDLYDRWLKGEKGIYIPTNPATQPNAKWFHLYAFDASNISPAEEEWLKSKGWVRPNKANDPVHFAYASKVGGIVDRVKDAATSRIKTDPEIEKKEKEAWSNIKYVGNIQATEVGGYLRTDPDFYTNPEIIFTVKHAIQAGEPNPLDSIPKKPGFKYPTFNASTGRFVWS